MSDPFVYTELPPGHIRLLLQVKDDSTEVTYQLHDALLDDDLRFRAVSYAWGSPSLTESITCDGEKMLVTSSVFELLSSAVISSLCDELPIWVDATCIDQSDDAEKAEQVGEMASLYSLAEEVIVWLGPASSDSDLAMDTIRALAEKRPLISLENFSEFSLSGDTIQKAGLANAG